MTKYAFCKVNISPVRKENRDASEMVTQLLFGELVTVLGEHGNFLLIESFHDAYQGYIDWKQVEYISEKELKKWTSEQTIQRELFRYIETPWGKQLVSRGSFVGMDARFSIGKFTFEVVQKSEMEVVDVCSFAMTYLNTPYLWGGKSAFGIDCSGFVQQVFRMFGINLPRDAYQQEEYGLLIDFADREAGDLAFFTNDAGKVTHVGILLSKDEIIHASAYVRIDLFTENGIFSKDYNKITHQLATIKRV